MPKVSVYNEKGEKMSDLELSDKIFAVKLNEDLLHQAVVTQMANERQVLAHTLTKAEVRGGGKKPWRQKGTGRARSGSSRSPIWVGGGVTFGPRKDRNFKKDINIKMKRKAMFMALSDRAATENLIVLDKIKMAEFKTKNFESLVKNLENKAIKKVETGTKVKQAKRSILIINDKNEDESKYSARNLEGVNLINLDNINILDILKYKNLILTLPAVKKLEERYK